MKIVLTSDELHPIHHYVKDWLTQRGHHLVLMGAICSSHDESWVACAQEATDLILQAEVEEGIFFCWTGTGISMAANRNVGIRAALCHDAETARAARIWNHANVLVLSNRTLSQGVANEILSAWYADYDRTIGAKDVTTLDPRVINDSTVTTP